MLISKEANFSLNPDICEAKQSDPDNQSDPVMMNHNAPNPKPAANITG